VVDPGAREVVAKLGAAAAARAGSYRAAIRQSCNVPMTTYLPNYARQRVVTLESPGRSLVYLISILLEKGAHPSSTNVAHPALYVSWVDQVLSPPTWHLSSAPVLRFLNELTSYMPPIISLIPEGAGRTSLPSDYKLLYYIDKPTHPRAGCTHKFHPQEAGH
jgi:hypothetical protein